MFFMDNILVALCKFVSSLMIAYVLHAGINFSTLEKTPQEGVKALLCHERCLFRYFLSVETDEKKKSKENKDEGANV